MNDRAKNQPLQENKMGVMPINKLLITMSLPMVASMLIQSLYNIVDSLFVARYSQDALTAVSLAFPVQTLVVGVAVGTGVGINALLSRSLGEKNFKTANLAANNGLLLTLISYLVFLIFGIFFSRSFFEWQGVSDSIVDFGAEYMTICMIGCFGQMMAIVLERLLIATGRTVHSMISQGAGAIINIILDPLMIFGIGFPKMGIAGAALATAVGQFGSMVIALILNLKFNRDIRLSFKLMRLRAHVVGEIYRVGVPSIMMQSITSVMTFLFNKILLSFDVKGAAVQLGTVGTTVFGVYFKFQSFVFMPIFGLNNGMVPIVAYNYGARRGKRVKKTVLLAATYAVGYMLICLAVFQLIPDIMLGWFNADADMIRVGVPALRTLSLPFIFAGVAIVFSSMFQALGNAGYSLVVSVARQLVVLLPAAFLLSKISMNAVWWAFPIAELMSLACAVFFYFRVYKAKVAPIMHSTEPDPAK